MNQEIKNRLICATRQFRHNSDNSPDFFNPREGFVAAYDRSEVDDLVNDLQARVEKAEARADNCEQQAKIWKQEARTQSAIVAEIYQELTGKAGEPGDWNGVRPLKPAILRKQAEAVEEVQDLITMADSIYEMQRAAKDYAQRLRTQAAEMEKGEGDA